MLIFFSSPSFEQCKITEAEILYWIVLSKALISFAVTAQLICVFLFAYACYLFSHVVTHLIYAYSGQVVERYESTGPGFDPYLGAELFPSERRINSTQNGFIPRQG